MKLICKFNCLNRVTCFYAQRQESMLNDDVKRCRINKSSEACLKLRCERSIRFYCLWNMRARMGGTRSQGTRRPAIVDYELSLLKMITDLAQSSLRRAIPVFLQTPSSTGIQRRIRCALALNTRTQMEIYLAWEPSQNGLFPDFPQRQRVTRLLIS